MATSAHQTSWTNDEKKLFEVLENYLYSREANQALGFVAGWLVFSAKRCNKHRDTLLAEMNAGFDEPPLEDGGECSPIRVGQIRYPKSSTM